VKPATNRLSYGMALSNIHTFSIFVSSVALSPFLEFASSTNVGCAFIIQSCSLPKTRFRGGVMSRLGSPREGKHCLSEEVSGKAILVSS
jgi:hypothetical protein